ncbi:PAS domain-containing protein [Nostoc sp. MS1]|uniref:PAS domain-containing protein n=1 Tax=Nostoc sp. MS1 TaxID=2764711 RepID=UPI001CC52E32|nr:PAS domain-containing protein [Nostoc sp. MS1]BCL37256.1 hypothetical protein NSMS1_37030 [Nostoc sp. MS1]
MVKAWRKILIVDDSPEDREMYRRYLSCDRDYAYNFLEANLGTQGLELWQKHQPDAVLLDYRLPDLDGVEFLTRLQSLTQQTYLPVIMVTGQGNEAIAVQAMKAGAQDYLIKEQMTPEVLQLGVNVAIETVQLRIQLQQRIERERLVSQITQKIHQSLDLAEILQTTVTEVRQFLQTDRVVIFRLQNGCGIVATESVGLGWTPLLSTTYHDACFNENYVEAFRQGLVTAKTDIYDGSVSSCHAELLAKLQVRANLVVPILQDNQLWGMLIAHHCTAPRQWQTLEIDLLQELATHLGIALRQAELYQQAQHELVERRRVEAELRESEERLRVALEASRMGTWDWHIQTGVITWSENLEALFGLAKGEFDGSFGMFVERIHPEDRDRVLAAVAHAVATGEDYDIEFRVVYPNGTIRWALSQGKVFYDQNGQPLRMAGNDIDITERKRSAQALRDSELKFRQLAENIDAVFWIKEVDEKRVSYVSPAYELLWGLKPEELYANPNNWFNLIHLEDQVSIRQAFEEKAIADQFDEEYRIILPNGKIRWVRDRCFGLKNEAGKVYRFTGIAEDITERKQQELNKQFLNQLDLRLRHLHDASTMMWEAISSLGQYLKVNRCSLGKMDRQQGIYILEQEWCRDVASSAGTYQLSDFATLEFQTTFAANQPAIVHDIITDPRTGAFASHYASNQVRAFVAIPCVYQGQLAAVLCISSTKARVWTNDEVILLQESVARIWSLIEQTRAMQALRDSDERLNMALNVTGMGVWDWNIKTNEVIWSPQHEILLGYAPGKPYRTYEEWAQRVHPEDLARVEASLQATMLQKKDYQCDYRVIWPNGSIQWLTALGRYIYDSEGQAVRMHGVLFDTTNSKQAQIERDRLLEQEKAARAEAERANRIKDEFLAVLSHELRSPLNPILGWAKLLQHRKFDPQKTASALATIERNAYIQTQLIDDLLDVAKILRGKFSMDETPVNLVMVIEGALDTVRTSAVAKSIFLHPVLAPVGQVSGDSARLQQVVWNLLSNAIKFTPEGGQIDIRLERVGNQAQISVKDTGKGINPEFLPYIFESFRQEDASTTRKYGGLGLGLAIVRHLVEAHGGTIQADSPGLGQGAKFTVWLPLLETTAQEIPPDELTPEADLTGIKVLIVDDEPDARELIQVVLEQYGAEVLAATCADEVLASLPSFQPDVFISDIGMPDIDGYALMQQVRSLPPEKRGQIKAIALSAYARVEDQQRSLAVGFQHHMSKPVDLDKLVQTVFELASS